MEGLGTFIEVEAIDSDGSIGEQKLKAQCKYYREFLGIYDEHLLHASYSDMLLHIKKPA